MTTEEGEKKYRNHVREVLRAGRADSEVLIACKVSVEEREHLLNEAKKRGFKTFSSFMRVKLLGQV